MPPYPGMRHSMEVNVGIRKDSEGDDSDDDWGAQYQEYLVYHSTTQL